MILKTSNCISFCLSIALALGFFPHAIAADSTWTGAAGGNWSDSTKWSSSAVADGSGSTANFNTLDLTADVTVRLDSDRTLTNLVFGDISTATAASWILGNNGSSANNLILAGVTPTITVNALGSGKSTTISAVIQGSAGLAKAGAGALVLAANNTYTGTTAVSAGLLRLGAAGAFGDAVTLTGGAILDLAGFSPTASVPLNLNGTASGFDVGAFYNSGASTAVYSGPVSLGANTSLGAGNITLTGPVTGNGKNLKKDGVNTLSLSGSGNVSLAALLANRGTIQVDGGAHLNVSSINVGSGNSVGAGLTLNGGSVTSTGTARFGTGSGSASGTLNLNSGTLTVPGITKGPVTFNANFNGGTLKAGAANAAFLNSATTASVLAGGAFIDDGGFAITIAKGLASGVAADGGLTKSGSGTLTLTDSSTYNGPTTIVAGTLAFGSSAALAPDSDVFISAGSRLDLSSIANHFWSPTAGLTVSGGTTLAGEIRGGSTIDLGTVPVALNISPVSFNGDSSHPALVVSQGTLHLDGPVTVTNLGGSPLSDGTYVLIRQVAGNLSGAPTLSGPVGGQGIAPGRVVFLRSNGGDLELVVDSIHPTTTTIQRLAGTGVSSAYGDALQFDVTITPTTAAGTVEIRNGGPSGVLLGTAAMTGGTCTITIPETALAVGFYPNIVASYQGNINHLASTSAPLAPAQSVAPKPLTINNAAASDKYFDGTTTASISGTLAGVEEGDIVTLVPSGLFASASPGTNIAVISTATLSGASAAKYSLTQPTGLTADIIAASIWTGGAGNTGTHVATGTNYSPSATPANVYNASFNGTDPATTDLTLSTAIGGAVGTSGMVFSFAANQSNPVTITGSTGASARIASIIVAPGAGAITYQGVLPFILGGPSVDTSHSFINDSVNPLVFQNTGNWIPGGSGTPLRSMFFGGVGDITVASGIVPSVPARMSLTKSGSGVLTLSGANTFSGGTTVSEGKVIATTSNALGAGAVVNHGTLDLTAGAVNYTGLSSALSGSGVVNVTLGTGSASTTLNGNYSNFTGTWNLGIGAAAGAGKVQMNGPDHPSATIRVLENATLLTSGAAVVHHASLVLYGGNTGESLGQLRIEGGATWTGNITLVGPISGNGDGHVGANSGTGTITGSIGETGGSHGLVKEGDGTTVLSGINSFTGTTLINDGVLRVNTPGSLAAASSVTVSGGATLEGSGIIHGPVTVVSGGTIGGSLTLNSPVTVQTGGTLDATHVTQASLNVTSALTLSGFLDLSIDRTRLPNASNLTISGTLNRGGTLRIINTGPALQSGDSFAVSISGGQVTGSFASTLFPALDYGLAWNTSQLASSGIITVVPNTSFSPSTVTLTPTTVHQQIHGMGANFCLGPQGIAWNTTQFNEIFSPEGLNISFARLANSFECELDEPDIFWRLWHSDNARFIRLFRALQPDGLITMSAWSPPGRLKSTGSAQGGTLAKNGSAYRYADYANWWLRSLEDLRENNPTLPVEQAIPDFISIQNEADFTPGGTFYAAWQAGNYLNATETSTRAGYPQALAAVKSAFAANGFGFVKFIGPDTTTASPSVITSYLNQLPANGFAAIAHHPYQGSTNNVGNNTSSLSGLRAAYPQAAIYMTEFFGDDSYGEGIPGWMMHALPMHSVLTIGKANTYLMWGLSLNPTSDTYCALGHYSKFLRPDDWRVAATSSDPNVVVSLYRHPVASGLPDQLILVMTNKSANYSYQTIRTSAHWAADPARRAWEVYKTANDGSSQQRLTLTENLSGPILTGNRNLVLAPYSMTTVLINSDAAPTSLENWRLHYFGNSANLGNAADTFDSDGDGETNLYEFATGQNPNANTRVTPTMLRNGANFEFTYTRSKNAVADGLTFTVEWSDTLEAGSWSASGISSQNPPSIAQHTETETLGILVPVGTGGRRFVRLKVTGP
jgi:autotransporter-associated beta strand protein